MKSQGILFVFQNGMPPVVAIVAWNVYFRRTSVFIADILSFLHVSIFYPCYLRSQLKQLFYVKPRSNTVLHLMKVEHRTGIAEVTGSNPVEALIFSGFFFPAPLVRKFTAMIILHFHLQPQYKYDLFHIYWRVLYFSRSKRIINALKAPFWLCLEKPLTSKTAFVICLVQQFGSTKLSWTFDSNRRSFNYLSRPKLSLVSAHVKYGIYPGPQRDW